LADYKSDHRKSPTQNRADRVDGKQRAALELVDQVRDGGEKSARSKWRWRRRAIQSLQSCNRLKQGV
jgi:hypothetical protein